MRTSSTDRATPVRMLWDDTPLVVVVTAETVGSISNRWGSSGAPPEVDDDDDDDDDEDPHTDVPPSVGVGVL